MATPGGLQKIPTTYEKIVEFSNAYIWSLRPLQTINDVVYQHAILNKHNILKMQYRKASFSKPPIWNHKMADALPLN